MTAGVTGVALAIALRAGADAVERLRTSQSIDIAWTGPATPEVPVRLTREVLLDVIGSASRSLILISFAAYRVADITAAIAAAAARGVDVGLVLETSEAEGGTLRGFGAAVGLRGAGWSSDVLRVAGRPTRGTAQWRAWFDAR